MQPDLYAVVAALAFSVVVVPTAVFALATTGDPPPDAVLGGLALTPGFVMGGAGLWIAARG